MARIAVDIDSTLYNFEALARDVFLQLAQERDDKSLFMGTYHPWVEWRSPADSCGLEAWLEVIARCHEPKKILAQIPFEGAVDTCWDLVESGHELIYISSRDASTEKATGDWLQACQFPLHNNLVVCGSDKSAHLADVQYLIDDRPKTVIEFVHDYVWHHDGGDQRKAFVKAYPYNQALTDIKNVYLGPTWEALAYYMRDKGLIFPV